MTGLYRQMRSFDNVAEPWPSDECRVAAYNFNRKPHNNPEGTVGIVSSSVLSGALPNDRFQGNDDAYQGTLAERIAASPFDLITNVPSIGHRPDVMTVIDNLLTLSENGCTVKTLMDRIETLHAEKYESWDPKPFFVVVDPSHAATIVGTGMAVSMSNASEIQSAAVGAMLNKDKSTIGIGSDGRILSTRRPSELRQWDGARSLLQGRALFSKTADFLVRANKAGTPYRFVSLNKKESEELSTGSYGLYQVTADDYKD